MPLPCACPLSSRAPGSLVPHFSTGHRIASVSANRRHGTDVFPPRAVGVRFEAVTARVPLGIVLDTRRMIAHLDGIKPAYLVAAYAMSVADSVQADSTIRYVSTGLRIASA
eukprot:3868481-Rhodomonas_salina.4